MCAHAFMFQKNITISLFAFIVIALMIIDRNRYYSSIDHHNDDNYYSTTTGFSRDINLENIPTHHDRNGMTSISDDNDSKRSNMEKAKLYYQQQSIARRRLLHLTLPHRFSAIYNALVPEVTCPLLMRIGSVHDGGKWVCNPFEMTKNNADADDECLVYSMGINNEISFEVDLQTLTNFKCRIIAIDSNQQAPYTVYRLRTINAEIHRINIGKRLILTKNENNSAINEKQLSDIIGKDISVNSMEQQHIATLTPIEILAKHGHDRSNIQFMKIDIEGAEYNSGFDELFAHRQSANQSICQIFIEMHGNPMSFVYMFRLFAAYEYYLFSYEINGFHHSACEFSFIHQSCFERYGITTIFSRILM